MSCETEWIFASINRNSDLSYGSGLYQSRGGWIITRSKTAKGAVPDSELDTTSTSLTAYNAGVLQTITAPTRNILTFGTSRNWIETTDVFIESGSYHNRRPIYVSVYGQNSKYTPKLKQWIVPVTDEADATKFWWLLVEEASDRIFSGIVYENQSAANIPTTINRSYGAAGLDETWQIGSSDYLTPTGLTFTPDFAPYVGTSLATTGTGTGVFICQEDSINYDQPSVDWYTRRQTWIYNGSWQVK